jgi:hypothetical protein
VSNPRPGLCEQCGTPSRERVETVTGRLLCPDCADTVTAGTAALMTGGGAGEAVAIRGWLRRIRRWTKPTGGAARPKPDDGDRL